MASIHGRWASAPTFLVAGAVIIVAMLIVGCGGTTTTSGATTTAGAAGSGGAPIKIGLLAEQTGGLAAYGYAHVKVAKAVVQKINAEGGIAGRQIELVIEDTAGDPSTGSNKARKLIENDNVDFLMGSNSSAVVLSVVPVVKELKTVYFSTAGGAGLTEEGRGSRYVFELNTDVQQEGLAAAKFGVDTIGKKWDTAVVDYAWGQDGEKYFVQAMTATGGTVLSSVRVPLGTADWLKYLTGKVTSDAQGIYFANFGTDFLAFIRDLQVVDPTIQKIGANYVLSAQDIGKLGPAAEGTYALSGYPQYADAMNTQADKEYRQTIGMDEIGREVGTGKYLVASYQWSTWESIYTIKEVVEASGWASKKDNAKFIEALEGRTLQEGIAHPEGTKTIRAEDHLCLKGLYIEQVKGGKLALAKRMVADDIAYPATINYAQLEPLQ